MSLTDDLAAASAALRKALQQVAAAAGYGWDTVLDPKSV